MKLLEVRIIKVIIQLSITFLFLFLSIFIANPDVACQDKIGDIVIFKTQNHNTKEYENTNAICKKVGNHCYIYLADTVSFSGTSLEAIKKEFDNNIYPTCRDYFGAEPDIDNDPHITILIYDVKGVGGYFDRRDQGGNNNRDMIYVDKDWSIGPDLYGCIAHEFQHLIHYNMDSTEEPWVNEGFSEYASYVCGYGEHNKSDIDAFLKEPDNSLIDFYDAKEHYADYGAVYLFIHYLVQEYGVNDSNFTRSIVKDKADGITGIENHLPGYTMFVDIFKNWIVANYLDNSSIDPMYEYKALDIHVKESRNKSYDPLKDTFELIESSSVSNWAADYIKVNLEDEGFILTSKFKGKDSSQFINLLIYDNKVIEFNLSNPPDSTGEIEIDINKNIKEIVYIISKTNSDGNGEYEIELKSTVSDKSNGFFLLEEESGCFIDIVSYIQIMTCIDKY